MQALWLSLKDNVKCGKKLTDVIKLPPKFGKGNSFVIQKEEKINKQDEEEENFPFMKTPARLLLSKAHNTQARLYELGVGDPSRKIVEMIFQKAWMNTSKHSRKVRTVLRVRYSEQVLERFEKYREKVKKEYPRHPRSTVDGNELLRFYVTTMRCFQRKKVCDLCEDPSCCFCRIIQFNFDEESAEIQMNVSHEDLSDGKSVNARVKNVKRVSIVCRIIAGNEVDGEYEEGFENDSSRLGEMQFSLERFVVKNPCSILPCFVIIFN
ncbi:uncharacterized protein LOC131615753 isoform X2 [Vicia villosa]|uniref:uncharacterized protein LOC131615753 isoform X2 n=1 Tax=Vicia villosa TaxID=3911 RepID=UPI00273C41A6|nr:uncharacterized protein LOC131615753 isoform X2 [Vicia villosa]